MQIKNSFKKLGLFAVALSLSAMSYAYGISPSRASQGKPQGQPGQASQSFQLGQTGNPQPQPFTLNQGQPGPAGQPGQPMQVADNGISPNIANYQPDEQYKAWKHIQLDEAKAMNADPANIFIDARAKAEYDQGHIPGAIPLPSGEFDKYYAMYKSQIKKAKNLISYCHGAGCKLSEKTAEQLYKTHGFKNVTVFFGGWPQWTQNNLPVETGPEPKKR